MTEEIAITTVVIAAGGYVGTKLFGTALANMGDDINKLYAKGRDKIVEMATKKVSDPDDGKKVNLRSARDVLWNGAITDDEVCAEYFGGMLAAARSEDGKDDAVVNYVDTIKAMSARQLELHYVIYKAWQNLLISASTAINVGQSSEVQKHHIFLNGLELIGRNLKYDLDLPVLSRLGLLGSYKHDTHRVGEVGMPYLEASPTIFGVMLFAVAHNKLQSWRSYPAESYESASGIKTVEHYASDLERLCSSCGMPFKEPAA
jgi:hypothetical protein